MNNREPNQYSWYNNELFWITIILIVCFSGCNTCTYIDSKVCTTEKEIEIKI